MSAVDDDPKVALSSALSALGDAAGGRWAEVEADEAALQVALLRCIVGPFRPAAFDPRWLTPDVAALARAAFEGMAWDTLPVLADALEDAGATGDILAHLRGPCPHVRGCWALDLVLGKK